LVGHRSNSTPPKKSGHQDDSLWQFNIYSKF
jgi:hypothetical protein